MSRIIGKGSFVWLISLLAIVAIILGLRSERTISKVLSPKGGVLQRSVAQASTMDSLRLTLEYKDSLLANALPGKRDPFRDPPVRRTSKPRRPSKPPQPEPETPPELRALLFDSVNPSAQFSSSAGRSDWLHVGDSYRGWLIDSITENSVKISKGNRTLVLSAF